MIGLRTASKAREKVDKQNKINDNGKISDNKIARHIKVIIYNNHLFMLLCLRNTSQVDRTRFLLKQAKKTQG